MVKSRIILIYTRPPEINEEPRVQVKDYQNYNDALSTAVDAGLRLALAGYGVRITCGGVEVINWDVNKIRNIYKFR